MGRVRSSRRYVSQRLSEADASAATDLGHAPTHWSSIDSVIDSHYAVLQRWVNCNPDGQFLPADNFTIDGVTNSPGSTAPLIFSGCSAVRRNRKSSIPPEHRQRKVL